MDQVVTAMTLHEKFHNAIALWLLMKFQMEKKTSVQTFQTQMNAARTHQRGRINITTDKTI